MVLVLARVLLVQDALKQTMASKNWKDWKESKDRATRATANELEEMIYNTQNVGFLHRVKMVVALLEPGLKLIRALEHNKPNMHMVWFLVSQVIDYFLANAVYALYIYVNYILFHILYDFCNFLHTLYKFSITNIFFPQLQALVTGMDRGRWQLFSASELTQIELSLEERWKGFHKPVHSLAYLVHPKFWDDTKAMEVTELMLDTETTLHRLLPATDAVKAIAQLTQFRSVNQACHVVFFVC